MKIIVLYLVLFMGAQSFAQDQMHPIDIKNKQCIELATPTTIGSINCEKEALEAWQAELEIVLQRLQKNPELLDIALLQESQTRWEAFHKAEVNMYYSYYQKNYQGGTMARVAAISFEKSHLRARVFYLMDLDEELNEH